ncbi:Uncharacterised protein [Moraxella ovis]|uniref:Uncharacterized protein n=1 Tax=Moraxella ovis TaxID=29433 RepID=A0A378PKL4_9GAMM|nr:Uncharacterised protein [Moraxella ovis]
MRHGCQRMSHRRWMLFTHTPSYPSWVFFCNNTANLAVFLIGDEIKVSVYCALRYLKRNRDARLIKSVLFICPNAHKVIMAIGLDELAVRRERLIDCQSLRHHLIDGIFVGHGRAQAVLKV